MPKYFCGFGLPGRKTGLEYWKTRKIVQKKGPKHSCPSKRGIVPGAHYDNRIYPPKSKLVPVLCAGTYLLRLCLNTIVAIPQEAEPSFPVFPGRASERI
jgi:hypothetical protein